MHIDTYEFGRIVIDGVEYTSDCLILGDTVQADWWRRQGHLLIPEDIQLVLDRGPDTLVVGCGASGMMKIDETARRVLRENEIRMEASDTQEAVERFNRLSQEGSDVAAAFHLTC